MSSYENWKDSDQLDWEDAMRFLESKGYGWLVEALCEESAYTRKGRLKKTVLERLTGVKTTKLPIFLRECRKLLNSSYGINDENLP